MIHNWEPKPNTNIQKKRIRKAMRKIDWDPVRDPAREVALAREAQGDHGPNILIDIYIYIYIKRERERDI